MNKIIQQPRVMVACGGTGGHVFPGLAVAAELRDRGCDVTILLAGKPVERIAIAGWEGKTLTVPARGISSRTISAVFSAAWALLRAVIEWRRLMRESKPQALLAMGGYASGGPILTAWLLGVPVVLHEANVIPGRAVRWFSSLAQVVALGFTETKKHLRHPRLVVTGLPLRKSSDTVKADELFAELRKEWFTVMIMGGSAGARRLNEVVPAAITRLVEQGRRVQVIHLAGAANVKAVQLAYNQCNAPAVVLDFLHDMPAAYRRADCAVCRAGAATCAELALYGLPALLVPYPFAAADHQTANARALADDDAADIMPEPEFTVESLAEWIADLMDNPDRRQNMRTAALDRAIPDAAAQVADLVLNMGSSVESVGEI